MTQSRKDISIVIEAEDFGNGWCVMPVLLDRYKKVRAAFENGYRDYPDMGGLYSGGRYRYSGTKLTGCYPVTEVTIPEPGEYVLWARSRTHKEEGKGSYLVQIGDWQSMEFATETATTADSWCWQSDRLRIDTAGPIGVTLKDTAPEACCDVIVLTTDSDYRPHGPDVRPSDSPAETSHAIHVPHSDSLACREAITRDTEVFEIHHGRVTSYSSYFGDLDGDGKDELIMAFEDEHIEAFKYSGESLWRCDVSFPWQTVNKDNYRDKGYNFYILHDFRPNESSGSGTHIIGGHVLDIDGDGQKEFVFGWNPVYVIDAHTGRIKQQKTLPGQGARLDIADLTGNGKKTEIVVATKDAVDGRAYVFGLDCRLQTLWQTRVQGADIEHVIAVGDIDGDGKDEVAFTVSNNMYCIDHDGSILLELIGRDKWGTGQDFHSDRVLIDNIDDDPSAPGQIIQCEGVILNPDGTIRWRGEKFFEHTDERGHFQRCFDHGQTVMIAKMRDDIPGKQMFFGERDIGNVYCFTAKGKLLWKRGIFHNAPGGVSVSTILPINWSGHGRKEILCRYLGIFDVHGNLVKVPPYVNANTLAPYGHPGAPNHGIADMLGDDRDEIVVTIGTTTYIVANTA